ncbi:MAG: PVC-type heme-binding CxxCH protein, partial [Verrucomicrobiales bacterium]
VYILDGERWTRPRVGTHPAENAPPPFVREDGSNNGVWMDEKSFIIQNEDTAEEPNVIRRIPFSKVLTDPPPVTLTPRDALQGMSTKPDLEVQVAVQEPLVMDPIDLAWGPDGKLWVVEMTDYPLGIDDNGKVGGRVRFLEDKDQDGRYETSSLFLEGLRYPTSVMAWRKGALVLAAPDLLYAEDTTGDGKADKREVLYTGFTEGNQQHRANGLRWGLDNWIYVANGDSGGEIKSNKTRTTVSLGHHDLRIRPDEGLLELVAGQTQFGRNRNDAGDWFGCNNSNPLWHYVLDDVALKRNPHFSPPSGIRHMPEVPGNAPVFPISVTEERFNDFHTANCITSACGTMIYRASLLGPAYQGNAFICEPVHNLVHRQVISTDGVTFASTRADDELTSEFLSSTDPSFRPVSMHTAPDGSLWVADMQREVIEHPEWIPHDREEQLDLRAGHERGTLYRLAPKGHQAVATPDLTKLEDDALVVMLDNDSGTMRDLAQQALLWRDAPKVEDVISSPNWKMRLHALATLDGVERVSVPTVSKALEDSHPAVRRLAMRLAGQLGGDWDFPQENDPTVLLQKAITLGALKDHGEDIASLALSSSDTYIRATCVSSMLSDIDGFMAVLTHALLTEDHAPFLRWVMNSLKGANETGALNAMAIKLSQSAEPESWQLDMISLALPNEELMISIAPLIETSRQWVDNPDADTNLRVAALEMLGKGQVLKASEELTKFCQPGEPAALQIASLRLLAELFPDEMPNWLLSSWPNLEPDLRLEVSLALASRPAIAKVVVNRLADDPIPDLARSLSQHQNTDVSAAADKLIDQPLATDQQSLITEVLSKKGLPASGKAHFQQVCSVCHVLEGQGNDVGPDLASLADPSKEFLLNAILNPNQAVEDKYLAYIAETTNGQATVGLLESETGGALHLRLANGDAQDVLRRDLVKLTSTGRSLMPEGLTGSLASQDVADLIAYVQSAKTPRKTFEFNEPKQVDQEEDGTINLAATAASVHGPSLTFERRYLNLGNWCHVQDQAVWTFTCTKPGRYAIALDFSCADGSAGNKLSLTLGDQRQTATIEGTGNWNGYRQTQIGTFELTEGTHELSARSEGSIRDHLIDLRNIILRPNPEN